MDSLLLEALADDDGDPRDEQDDEYGDGEYGPDQIGLVSGEVFEFGGVVVNEGDFVDVFATEDGSYELSRWAQVFVV